MAEESSIAGAGDACASSSSPSPSSSPKTSNEKIKLRCSHGGKIMARPPDGQLKYIGGETRVVAIPRDVTFSELMKKLSDIVDGEIVLKYHLMPEELDTLVSLRSDEDLKHMMEEYERQEHEGVTPKMRAYLFPSKPLVIESNPSLSSHALEQRYIDAINGIIRSPPPQQLRTAPCSGRPSFSINSPSSSPKVISPDKIHNPWDASNCSSPKRKLSMHKVRSSPSLYHDGEIQQQGSGNSQFSRQHGMYQVYQRQSPAHGYLYPQQHLGGLYSVKSLQPQDFYRGVGRLEHHGRGGLMFGPSAMDRFYPGRGGRPYMNISSDNYSTIDRSDSIPQSRRDVVWEL